MPNWCSNSVKISHSDPDAIKRFQTAFAEKRLFAEFVPEPVVDESKLDWYFWRRTNWGTKWDAGGDDFTCEILEHEPEPCIQCYFDTAWTPPLPIYQRWTELGYTVYATYYEPGVGFVGRWTSEDGDDCYEIEFTVEGIADLPEDLVDEYGIEPWENDDEED